jgi:hypothetical protein
MGIAKHDCLAFNSGHQPADGGYRWLSSRNPAWAMTA